MQRVATCCLATVAFALKLAIAIMAFYLAIALAYVLILSVVFPVDPMLKYVMVLPGIDYGCDIDMHQCWTTRGDSAWCWATPSRGCINDKDCAYYEVCDLLRGLQERPWWLRTLLTWLREPLIAIYFRVR